MASSASWYHHISATSFFCNSTQNDQNTPPDLQYPIPLPQLQSPSPSILDSAAAKIQSRYRSRLVRSLVRKILAVDSQADRFQALIQQQETVDSIRSDERERTRLNERLMALLLKLDEVPGHFDPNVRELRRRVSRRIVALQEIVDGIVGERLDDEGFETSMPPRSLEEFVEKFCWEEEEEDEREDCSARGEGRKKVMRCLEEFIRGM